MRYLLLLLAAVAVESTCRYGSEVVARGAVCDLKPEEVTGRKAKLCAGPRQPLLHLAGLGSDLGRVVDQCAPSATAGQGTCKQAASKSAGDACVHQMECGVPNDNTESPLWCSSILANGIAGAFNLLPAGTCQAASVDNGGDCTPVTEAQPTAKHATVKICKPGHFCDVSTSKCKTVVGQGADCDPKNVWKQCSGNLICSKSTSKCVTLASLVGSSCTDDCDGELECFKNHNNQGVCGYEHGGQAGTVCDEDENCKPPPSCHLSSPGNLYCKKDSNGRGQCTVRQNIALYAEGCKKDSDCATPTNTKTVAVCDDDKCQPRVKLGQTGCDDTHPNTNNKIGCVGDVSCETNTCSSKQSYLGGKCSSALPCETTLTCLRGVCLGNQTVDQPCTSTHGWATGSTTFCEPGLVCLSGTCKAPVSGTTACQQAFGLFNCGGPKGGQACNGVTDKCVTRNSLPAGSELENQFTAFAFCAPGLVGAKDGNTWKCKTLATATWGSHGECQTSCFTAAWLQRSGNVHGVECVCTGSTATTETWKCEMPPETVVESVLECAARSIPSKATCTAGSKSAPAAFVEAQQKRALCCLAGISDSYVTNRFPAPKSCAGVSPRLVRTGDIELMMDPAPTTAQRSKVAEAIARTINKQRPGALVQAKQIQITSVANKVVTFNVKDINADAWTPKEIQDSFKAGVDNGEFLSAMGEVAPDISSATGALTTSVQNLAPPPTPPPTSGPAPTSAAPRVLPSILSAAVLFMAACALWY